jgi:hypothetical protein
MQENFGGYYYMNSRSDRFKKSILGTFMALVFAFTLIPVPMVSAASYSSSLFAGTGTTKSDYLLRSDWSNPNRIRENDDNEASALILANMSSEYLYASDFGFSIPDYATIDGITVRIGRHQNNSSYLRIRDVGVYLTENGVSGAGDNKADTGTNWPQNEAVAVYGSTSDTWGTSWTPDMINSPDFGVMFSVRNSAILLPNTAYVDFIRVVVRYTIPDATISFDTAGGSSVTPITAEIGSSVAAPSDPTLDGYTFAGWNPVMPETMPEDGATLIAQWTANDYTITFDSAGGSPVESITQPIDSPIIAPSDPTLDGYTFIGWDPVMPETMPLGGSALTAQWAVNPYTITFNTDGGSPVADILQDFGSVITPPADPTRDGYTFNGWDPAVPETMPLGGASLTALWTFVPTASPTPSPTTSPTASPTPTSGVLGVDKLTPVPNRVLDIRGTVLDKNNVPLVGYTIELQSTPVTVVTDANGAFAFNDTTLETHTFIVKNAVGDVLKTFTFNVTTGTPFSWTQVDGVTYNFYIDTNTIGIDITVQVDGSNVTITAINAITNPKTGDMTDNQWILFLALPVATVAVCVVAGRKQAKRKS